MFLAVIGPRWLTTLRSLSGEDLVAAEIAEAIATGTTIVPVLVGGATMPADHELPEP